MGALPACARSATRAVQAAAAFCTTLLIAPSVRARKNAAKLQGWAAWNWLPGLFLCLFLQKKFPPFAPSSPKPVFFYVTFPLPTYKISKRRYFETRLACGFANQKK